VSSAIIDKYIGESARLIREMFGYAREHQVSWVMSLFHIFLISRNLEDATTSIMEIGEHILSSR
jgi:ATP-dependent 26S proteasome regulatory subunit